MEQFFGTTTAAPFDDCTYVSTCGRDDDITVLDRSDSIVAFTLRPNTEEPLWIVADGQESAP